MSQVPRNSDVTTLLELVAAGDPLAPETLLPLVYSELRRLAAAHFKKESQPHVLQPTALVHEAYLKLVGGKTILRPNSRNHFFAAAATAMRQILTDHARANGTLKRGGGLQIRRYDEEIDAVSGHEEVARGLEDIEMLDVALSELEVHDESQARAIGLRVFAGLSVEEVASCLDVSESSVRRLWKTGIAWLNGRMLELDAKREDVKRAKR
jgi:RNA polymerase sigma factor (TIGR02999 family)